MRHLRPLLTTLLALPAIAAGISVTTAAGRR